LYYTGKIVAGLLTAAIIRGLTSSFRVATASRSDANSRTPSRAVAKAGLMTAGVEVAKLCND